MLVLDENLPAGQRLLLRKWRIRFRRAGVDFAAFGDDDEQLLPLLHRLPNPTFFTLDRDFFRADWAHHKYCLIWLDVPDDHAAEFIRRFLRHPRFNTKAKRMGGIARVHAAGVRWLPPGQHTLQSIAWPPWNAP